jgi:hypothetical protein
MTEETFDRVFGKSALTRRGLEGIRRNLGPRRLEELESTRFALKPFRSNVSSLLPLNLVVDLRCAPGLSVALTSLLATKPSS